MNRLHVLHSDPSSLPKNFWESSDCELMIMGRWAEERPSEAQWLRDHLPSIQEHVWMATSGTLAHAGESQWIALSKKALLTSAASVNKHLEAKASDVWGLTLPLAHVGGLGILARAHLLGQRVIELTPKKWDPRAIAADSWSGNLLSLVPTQVHDLVRAQVPPPESLRAVVVGGDRLSSELLNEALKLGWPLLASYGMTECCSQIATAKTTDGKMFVLSHVKASIDESDRLWLDSDALFTGKALVKNKNIDWEPRQSGPWATQDRAEIAGDGSLTVLGRLDTVVKIRGEKVDVQSLENELQKKLRTDVVLLAIPDARDGFALWLITEKDIALDLINRDLLPHQKARGTRSFGSFPRTSLGKIRRGEIKSWLLEVLQIKIDP